LITGLDHIAVAVRDFDAAVDGYRRLLGRDAELRIGGGQLRASFRFGNAALEIVAPDDDDDMTLRNVRERLDAVGEGLWLAAFTSDDVAADARLLERRGLTVEAVADVAHISAAGLEFGLWPRHSQPLSATTADETATVAALDHLVVHTPNPDRALGLYGAKFGLDLRLDRQNEKWGVRQLFFRCGDAVFEVGASLKHPPSDAPDSFGGLAWRVSDPHAAQARLVAAGFDVSQVRPGRKPGTHVFTVRDAPGGVPTLMIQPSPALETA
jgi:catechol 2,3-dioxygenase-like lactoylglutathione lyase family enzyme